MKGGGEQGSHSQGGVVESVSQEEVAAGTDG